MLEEFDCYDDDEKTPFCCMVCDGEFIQTNYKTGSGTYRVSQCRWCTQGSMNESQFKRWKKWSNAKKLAG